MRSASFPASLEPYVAPFCAMPKGVPCPRRFPLDNNQTHPMQLALPLSSTVLLSLPEPLRSQVIGALCRLLLQVTQAAARRSLGPQEKGGEHAP